MDDPYFNLSYHLRRTALPAPGGDEHFGCWSAASCRSNSIATSRSGRCGWSRASASSAGSCFPRCTTGRGRCLGSELLSAILDDRARPELASASSWRPGAPTFRLRSWRSAPSAAGRSPSRGCARRLVSAAYTGRASRRDGQGLPTISGLLVPRPHRSSTARSAASPVGLGRSRSRTSGGSATRSGHRERRASSPRSRAASASSSRREQTGQPGGAHRSFRVARLPRNMAVQQPGLGDLRRPPVGIDDPVERLAAAASPDGALAALARGRRR